MDWLKSEIDSKKRVQDSIPIGSDHATKYIKKSDLERFKVQQQSTQKQSTKKSTQTEEQTNKSLPSTTTTDTTSTDETKPDTFNISNEEAIRRLRQKQQPIRLFGESDKDRRLRLRALELIEERSEGQQNDFLKLMDGMEKGIDLDKMVKLGGGASASIVVKKGKSNGKEKGEDDDDEEGEKGEPNPKDEEVLVDMELVRKNPRKIYPQIYHALKVSHVVGFVKSHC